MTNKKGQSKNEDHIPVMEAEEVVEKSSIPSEVLSLANVDDYSKIRKRAVEIIVDYQFSEKVRQIKDYEKELDAIEITDEFDFENMERCGTIRKALVKIRTGSKDKHDEIKEDAKIEGKFIDNLHNKIVDLEVPVEKKAEDKEKTADRIVAERKRIKKEAREKELGDLQYNFLGLDLPNMPDDVYARIVEDAKLLLDAKAKIKADREEADRKAFEDQQRIQAENELSNLRLFDFNKLGISYSGDDLGKLDEENYQILKANLVQKKNDDIKAQEDLRKQNEALQIQAKKDKEAQDKRIKDLQEKAKKEKEENDRLLKEQQDKIRQQESKIKEQAKEIKTNIAPSFSMPSKPKAKKDVEGVKKLRALIDETNIAASKFLTIDDSALNRVYKLYQDGITETGKRLSGALDEYEKR